jgi:hypothetical protein
MYSYQKEGRSKEWVWSSWSCAKAAAAVMTKEAVMPDPVDISDEESCGTEIAKHHTSSIDHLYSHNTSISRQRPYFKNEGEARSTQWREHQVVRIPYLLSAPRLISV